MTPDRVLAYTLSAGSGSVVGCTSGGGSSRAGRVSTGPVTPALIGGAVHTTANTTAAGLTTANRKTAAKKTRNTLERRAPASASRRPLLVRKIFKFRRQLADPSSVIETPNETG